MIPNPGKVSAGGQSVSETGQWHTIIVCKTIN